jgi:hypothetical protein
MKSTSKDNLAYLGVAGAVAGALAVYIFYMDRTRGTIPEIPDSILWGAISTPILVGLILERFWHFRPRRLLWGISVIAGCLNALAMALAYFLRESLPMTIVAPLTVVWFTVALVAVGALLRSVERH